MKGKLLIILLVIILLVAYAYFGMDYMKQHEKHEALTSQISDVSQAIAQMPEPPEELEQQLAAAQASLADKKSALASPLTSTACSGNSKKTCKVRFNGTCFLATKVDSVCCVSLLGEFNFHHKIPN